jgi:AbrB family looped-hinge helix DNA binding protein
MIILVPTKCGNMAKVDSKGRIVLPQEVRERLGITPGTEVEVREKDGKAVVEPEDNPERIISRMKELIAETAPENGETRPIEDSPDPIAQKHREVVRQGAEPDSDE